MKFSIFNFQFSKQIILLLCILLLAAVLRFWQFGHVPVSPDWDEAALGYNAYSVLHTGRDEYGKWFPIVFRSFDDYKPGLYVYLTIPFITLFGLTIQAVRMPSAILGILTVLGTYLLIKELFKKEHIALLSSFLLAISPWHIQFSRIAFEANSGVFFNVYAVLFFLKGLKRPWLLILSVLSSSLSMYVYQSEKVFAPLLVLLLISIFWKQLLTVSRKMLLLVFLFGILLILPLSIYTFTAKGAFARAQGVSVFADQTQTLKSDVVRLAIDQASHDKAGILFDNRRIVFAKEILSNYLSHFDLNWLFLNGDIARHHAPGMGLLYLWELPFLCIGIYMLLFGRYDIKVKWLVFGWFLLVPIPAAVTTGTPHAVRTINFLPLFQVFTALGIASSFSLLHYHNVGKIRASLLFGGIIFLFASFNFAYYLDQYFVQLNYYTSVDWQYGYAQTVPYIKQIAPSYKKIIVSNQPFMDQSYIFFLFYLRYSPAAYQKESTYASGGFREEHHFGVYDFRPIDWAKEEKSSDILYVGRPSDFPPGVQVLKQVNFLDGEPSIEIVKG